jgi:hypothetical protein
VLLNHYDLCNKNISLACAREIEKQENVPVIMTDARKLTPKTLGLLAKACTAPNDLSEQQVRGATFSFFLSFFVSFFLSFFRSFSFFLFYV